MAILAQLYHVAYFRWVCVCARVCWTGQRFCVCEREDGYKKLYLCWKIFCYIFSFATTWAMAPIAGGRTGGRTVGLAGMQANMATHTKNSTAAVAAQQIKKMETIHHGAFEHDIFVFGSNWLPWIVCSNTLNNHLLLSFNTWKIVFIYCFIKHHAAANDSDSSNSSSSQRSHTWKRVFFFILESNPNDILLFQWNVSSHRMVRCSLYLSHLHMHRWSVPIFSSLVCIPFVPFAVACANLVDKTLHISK